MTCRYCAAFSEETAMNYDHLERPHVVYSPMLWLMILLFWVIVLGTIYAAVMA